MRYVARQPREGINISKTHPLAEASVLVLGLTGIFITLVVVGVFLVEVALFFIPADKEAQLFTDWLPDNLLTSASDDERAHDTQQLLDRLTSHWPEASYQFRLKIEDSETANAMAFPGGLIVVTNALLDQVASENELAFVLSHELGHFKNRDHLRALGRSALLSVLFITITGSDASGIGIQTADLTLKSFNRRQETQADEFGLSLVQKEYGHVAEAWRLFERWDKESDMASWVTYLSTHPESYHRISHLRGVALDNGWRDTGKLTHLSWTQ